MKRKLRTGFTTGTAAAAAAKAALALLLEGRAPAGVDIRLLTGDDMYIPVHHCAAGPAGQAACTVIKDAGDDPDVTHKAEIGARVTLLRPAGAGRTPGVGTVEIRGGQGVGRVTKPGLEVAPGEAAINAGPRKMITRAVGAMLAQHRRQQPVRVEIFVPAGEEIAQKTLNARLGIIGGISILGTTGLVRPMSHEAFIATIEAALSVARAAGLARVVLTTGRRSERFAQRRWPQLAEEAFVQIGDFFQMSLASAAARGFQQIRLVVFFGKAVKMAQGVAHTHAARARLSLDRLAAWSLAVTGERRLSEKISAANTARQAFDLIRGRHDAVIHAVGRRIVKSATAFAGPGVRIQSVIFDYQGQVVFDSEKTEATL